MSKVYTLLDDNKLIDYVISENDELKDLKDYNVRFAVILVRNEDREGEVYPAFKSLPYIVKINSAKDRCIKHIDVEIHIDESYYEKSMDIEKEAIFYGALKQITIREREDFPLYHDDGVVKMFLKKPDMFFAGFSEVAEKYEDNSPERMAFRSLIKEFSDVLYF